MVNRVTGSIGYVYTNPILHNINYMTFMNMGYFFKTELYLYRRIK